MRHDDQKNGRGTSLMAMLSAVRMILELFLRLWVFSKWRFYIFLRQRWYLVFF